MRAQQRVKEHARQRRQSEKARPQVEARLRGFDCENCRAPNFLCEKLQYPNRKKLSTSIILPIAKVVSIIEGIPLPREAYRRRADLIFWCEKHFDPLQKIFARMVVQFSAGETIVGELAAQLMSDS